MGLSENEIKVYITVLSLWQVAISTISKKTWLKRTTNYAIVEKLSKDWILFSFSKSNIVYYWATDPELLLEKYKLKLAQSKKAVEQFADIIPILNNLKDTYKNKAKTWYFEWLEWIKAMYEDVIHVNKPVYWILWVHNVCDVVLDYLTKDYVPRRKKQITSKSKIIYLDNKNAHDFFNKSYNLSKFDHVVIDESLLNLNVSVQIYWNKAAFYSRSNPNDLHWIIIESETVVSTLKSIFLTFFNLLKKIK